MLRVLLMVCKNKIKFNFSLSGLVFMHVVSLSNGASPAHLQLSPGRSVAKVLHDLLPYGPVGHGLSCSKSGRV
jgi:hypothetical protein